MTNPKFNQLAEKHSYINKMHETLHSVLTTLSREMTDNEIKRIVIEPDLLWYEDKSYGLKLLAIPGDSRCYPFEIFNFGKFEQSMERLFIHLFSNSKCFIDIGANAGYYSLICRKTNKDCEIHAFEPQNKVFSYLIKQLEINHVYDIKCHQLSVSNTSGYSTFYSYDSGLGNSSLRRLNPNVDSTCETVETVTLDSIQSDIVNENIDLIKCDVEGAEYLVLRGGQNVLRFQRPIIHLELLRKWSSAFDYHPNDVLAFMNSFGYSCYTISSTGNPVIFIEMTDDEVETNFFFVHPESKLFGDFFDLGS